MVFGFLIFNIGEMKLCVIFAFLCFVSFAKRLEIAFEVHEVTIGDIDLEHGVYYRVGVFSLSGFAKVLGPLNGLVRVNCDDVIIESVEFDDSPFLFALQNESLNEFHKRNAAKELLINVLYDYETSSPEYE